jgi:hypothetical protein
VRLLAATLAALSALAAPAAARDPVDHSKLRAPDGTPMCAAWVHDRHTTEHEGGRWPSWHPPRDPRYGCAFGHEHGSSPRAFKHFRRTGMPAFGHTGALAGSPEAHAGFKVFVVNDDRNGLAWMTALHQGSASPRRAAVRFHSLETWLLRRRDGRLIAHTRLMGDFGRALRNCRGVRRAARMRLVPVPGCRSAYEEWATVLDVGGALRARPAFGIDNPATQIDPAAPERALANKARVCGPLSRAGWRSGCKGDRRSVLHPRWVVRNRGPARFRTDAFGRRAPAGIAQFVSSAIRVDQSRECCGPESAFVMERPSDGGIFRSGRAGGSRGFEFPGYCVLGPN